MDQDIDFEPTRSARKPNSSRRRREMETMDNDNLDAVLDSVSNSISKPQPQPRKNTRNKESGIEAANRQEIKAVSGWAEEDLDFNSGPSVQKSHRREPGTGVSTDFGSSDTNQNKTISNRKYNQREINRQDEEELQIPEIPDLEETEEPTEDMAFKIAEAPDVQVHHISTYKELDKEFFKEKAFQFLEGNIDVSLLHCGLNTEQQIAEEEDVIWEWNKLFTEVVSVLSTTKESELASEVDPFGGEEDLNKLKAESNSQGKRDRDIAF